jgi:hypothetical protein
MKKPRKQTDFRENAGKVLIDCLFLVACSLAEFYEGKYPQV